MDALTFGCCLSASTVATAKNGRNDSFTPSRRSKSALACCRSRAIRVTSASTTVVSCALVCSDSVIRLAMTPRSRDIFSVRPRSGDGSTRDGAAAGAAAGASAGAAVAGGGLRLGLRLGRLARAGRLEHVLLADPAADPGAPDAGEVDVVLGGELAYQRRHVRAAGRLAVRALVGRLRRGRRLGRGRLLRRGRGGLLRRRRRRGLLRYRSGLLRDGGGLRRGLLGRGLLRGRLLRLGLRLGLLLRLRLRGLLRLRLGLLRRLRGGRVGRLLRRRLTLGGRVRCRRGTGTALVDHRQLDADLDGLVLADADRGQRAGRGRRDLGVDLVGGHLEQRLVGLDPLALLLEPAGDGALGDALAETWHRDGDRHWSTTPSVSTGAGPADRVSCGCAVACRPARGGPRPLPRTASGGHG